MKKQVTQIQFIGITPEQLQDGIIKAVNNQLKDLKTHLQPKQPPTYLSRLEVSKMLKVSLVTLNKWHRLGKLNPVGIGGRVLYRLEDVQSSIVEL